MHALKVENVQLRTLLTKALAWISESEALLLNSQNDPKQHYPLQPN